MTWRKEFLPTQETFILARGPVLYTRLRRCAVSDLLIYQFAWTYAGAANSFELLLLGSQTGLAADEIDLTAAVAPYSKNAALDIWPITSPVPADGVFTLPIKNPFRYHRLRILVRDDGGVDTNALIVTTELRSP